MTLKVPKPLVSGGIVNRLGLPFPVMSNDGTNVEYMDGQCTRLRRLGEAVLCRSPGWLEGGRGALGALLTTASGLVDDCEACDDASDGGCDDCKPAGDRWEYPSLEGVWPAASTGWEGACWLDPPAVEEGRDCKG